MIIQLRSIGRAEPDDLAAILPTLSEAAAAVDLDHSRLAVVLDWVQYRKNFRAPVRGPNASATSRRECSSGPTCGRPSI